MNAYFKLSKIWMDEKGSEKNIMQEKKGETNWIRIGRQLLASRNKQHSYSFLHQRNQARSLGSLIFASNVLKMKEGIKYFASYDAATS